MRNRERIRQMKAYIPAEVGLDAAPTPPSGEIIDPLLAKYSRFSEHFPVVGVHLTAIDQLKRKTKNAGLSNEEREALLVHSLWSEDPEITAQITKTVGFDERKMNALIDAATYELETFSDTLLGIINDLRRKAASKNVAVAVDTPINPVNKAIQSSSKAAPQVRDLQVVTKSEKPEPKLPISSVEVSQSVNDTEFPEQRPAQERINYDHPILTKEQELMLFGHLKRKTGVTDLMQDQTFLNSFEPEDRERLEVIASGSRDVEEVIISCYSSLVHVIAQSFDKLPLGEAINAGNIGLIRSARRWKASEEAKFSTYAVWGVRSSIASEVFEQRSSIRLPAYVQRDLGTVKRVQTVFNEVFGRQPTTEELKQQLLANTDLPVNRVDNVIRVVESKVEHVGSINQQLAPDSEDEVGDLVADKTIDVEAVAIDRVAEGELQREIRRALTEHLTEEEGEITTMIYGLNGRIERDAREIARAWGVAPNDVEEIHRRSLIKLHRDQRLSEHWDKEPPSFVYRMSAERAAFKLGLFRGLKIERVNPPVPAVPDSVVFDVTPTFAESAQAVDLTPQMVAKAEPEKPNPYRDAIAKLGGKHALVITPEEGETLNELRVVFYQAAEEAGRKVVITTEGDTLTLRVDEGETSKRKRSSGNLQKVKELREQGLSDQEISDQLGITPGSVRTYAYTLIKNGELAKRPKGRRKTELESSEQPKEKTRKEGTIIFKVKELRNQGLGNQEIAEQLGVSYGVVAGCAVRLLRTGEITALKASGLEGRDDAEVIAEARKRVGMDVVIATDGNTRDRVKELRNQGYFNDEIAILLGVARNTVSTYASILLAEGEIEPHKKGARKRRNDDRKAAAVSEETRKVKEVLDAQPKYSYKDGFRRIFDAREKRPRRAYRKSEKTLELERQILELKPQGLTYYQIADKVGTNWMRVQAVAYGLIQSGQLEPKRRYTSEQARKRADKIANSREFSAQVRDLATQGLDIIQIAEQLDDSVQRVRFIVWKANREGVISVTPNQLRPARITGYVDKHASTPAGDSYKKVEEMRKQGLTNGEIATALNMKKHDVETLASNLIRAGVIEPHIGKGVQSYRVASKGSSTESPKGGYYDKVAELRKQGFGNQEIAQQLGIPADSVAQMASKLIRAGIIEPLKRGRQKAKEAEMKNAGTATNREKSFESRRIFRDALIDLGGKHELVVTPDKGETLAQIRGDLFIAAAEVGRKVRVIRAENNTLLVRAI